MFSLSRYRDRDLLQIGMSFSGVSLTLLSSVLMSFTADAMMYKNSHQDNDQGAAKDIVKRLYEVNDSHVFYEAIAPQLGGNGPRSEQWRSLVRTLKSKRDYHYMSLQRFDLHQNLSGMFNYSSGKNSKFEDHIYGRFREEEDGKSGNYSSLCLTINTDRFTTIEYKTGSLFYSNVQYFIQENAVHWVTATFGHFFYEDPRHHYIVMYGNYSAITEGKAQITPRGKLEFSSSSLDLVTTDKLTTKTLSNFFAEVELTSPAYQTAVLDANYLLTGENGSFNIKCIFGRNGKNGFQESTNGMLNDRYKVVFSQSKAEGFSLFNVNDTFSQENLQHFFNTIYRGRGVYVP